LEEELNASAFYAEIENQEYEVLNLKPEIRKLKYCGGMKR
jgi:hypothetical protein